jgi:hypothetical protein
MLAKVSQEFRSENMEDYIESVVYGKSFKKSITIDIKQGSVGKIFGEPSFFSSVENIYDDELIQYFDDFNIRGESFWIFEPEDSTSRDSMVCIECTERKNKNNFNTTVCISSDNEAYVDHFKKFITQQSWGDLDEIRVEHFLKNI